MSGQEFTVWSARLAAVFYAMAVALLLTRRPAQWERTARWAWTVGLLWYAAHVYAAFEYFYDWSHQVAYRETLRQTNAVLGVESGNGIYWNYVFSAVWAADCLWWWISADSYRRRSAAIHRAVQGFLIFMFFNGIVIFGHGPVRWVGLAVSAVLGALFLRNRHLKNMERPGREVHK